MESTGQQQSEPTITSPQSTPDRAYLATCFANAVCERVSSRFTLLVAKGIINENSEVGVFMNDAERAAYNSACNHLARLFGSTE